MVHHKVINREDGSEVTIKIELWDFQYTYCIWVTAKDAKFDYTDRSAATEEEIQIAHFELWNKLKPTL